MIILKRPILLLFLFLIGTTVLANKKNNSKDFKEEYKTFKYSLYKYLQYTSPSDLLKFEFSPNDSVNIVIDAFFNKNEREIQIYQTEVMKSLENKVIYSDKDYETENFDFNIFTEYKKEINSGIYRLLLLEPLNYANTIISVVESENMNSTEMALESVKNSIAQAKIISRKIDQSNWELIIDKYYKVYVLSYNISNNEMSLNKILRRLE